MLKRIYDDIQAHYLKKLSCCSNSPKNQAYTAVLPEFLRAYYLLIADSRQNTDCFCGGNGGSFADACTFPANC
jgi:phosphoheptose isomerase